MREIGLVESARHGDVLGSKSTENGADGTCGGASDRPIPRIDADQPSAADRAAFSDVS